jgi:hypothetical protein
MPLLLLSMLLLALPCADAVIDARCLARREHAAMPDGLVFVALATHPGRAQQLETVVNSVCFQADQMFIYLSGYTVVPDVLREVRNSSRFLLAGTPFGERDLRVIGRTLPLQSLPIGTFYFSVDDDIWYPPNYVEYMVAAWRRYPGAVVALHGSVFPDNLNHDMNWFTMKRVLPWNRDLHVDTFVHVVGTGVMMLRVGTLPISHHNFNMTIMEDPQFALIAQSRGVPLVVVRHNASFCRQTAPSVGGVTNRVVMGSDGQQWSTLQVVTIFSKLVAPWRTFAVPVTPAAHHHSGAADQAPALRLLVQSGMFINSKFKSLSILLAGIADCAQLAALGVDAEFSSRVHRFVGLCDSVQVATDCNRRALGAQFSFFYLDLASFADPAGVFAVDVAVTFRYLDLDSPDIRASDELAERSLWRVLDRVAARGLVIAGGLPVRRRVAPLLTPKTWTGTMFNKIPGMSVWRRTAAA